MGARKALRDPDAVEQFEELVKKKPAAAVFPDAELLLSVAAGQFHQKRRDEPEEVSQRRARACDHRFGHCRRSGPRKNPATATILG
ncbi:MAG TPA: hypothetical protein VN924_27985 [Bryobacteraceae bacterium]|nr:hypothetical protein [Bryobacteraceae bacterium]